ncbi:MAG: Ig-like domain-containing protein, partial [Eubacteriales bacterium]
MKYRKLLCLVLCIALCVPALAACTGSGPPPDDGGDDRYPFLAEVTGGYTLSGGQFKAVRYGNIPAALAGATVKPAGDVADSSVPTDASLLLCAAGAVDEEQIKRYVSISPSVDYTVEKLTDTEYSLTPVSNLEPGAVYSVDIGEEGKPAAVRFAFQTEAVFKLKSTLPADLAVGVPVNTGIELRFTEPVSGKDIAGHIKIEPAVEYEQRAYPDGKTVVLIPKDYLAENTVYTVSVSGELASAAGKTLGEDVTFKFRTEDESSVTAVDRVYIYPESQDLVFGTSQTPIFKWWVYTHEGQEIKESDALVKIWRYPSVHALADAVKMMAESRGDAYFSGEDFRYPTEGLEKVAEYTAPVTVLEQNLYNRKSFIELRTPGRGFYLCEVTLAASSSGESVKNTFQAIVQVTDMRLYTESQNSSMLLWLQGAGGLNVSAAKVTAELFKDSGNFYWNVQPAAAEYKTVEATADGDGICTIDTGDANYAYIIAEKGDDALFRYASIYDYKMARDYFATVFSDREVYFADDTINFRGFLRPARGGELPNRITVTTSVGAKFSLPVAPDGSFSGSYVLEDFVGWGIDFSFTDEAGNAVACKYVRVTQEEKPVYTASLAFKRPAYNYGEDAVVELSAAFFDGTPAQGLKFMLYFNEFSEPVTLTTDSEGKATYTLKTGNVSSYSTYPYYLSCSGQLMGYEGTTLYISAFALYFHSDVYLSQKYVTTDEGESYVLVTLDRFDPEKIAALESTEEIYTDNFPQNLFAGPAEGSVTVTLAETWYEGIVTGTTYDPITKKTSKTFRYEKRDKTLSQTTEKFVDGKLRLDYVDAPSDHYVYYSVSYRDTRSGNTFTLTISASNGRGDVYINRSPDNKYYELLYDYSPKSVGDFTELVLAFGGEQVSGKTLFTVYTDHLDRYAITTGTYSVRFDESYIAGNQINVAYFDGSDFAYIGMASLNYDYDKNSSLELEIVPDKDSYKPGEKATVVVRVVDKLTGKPVTSGAVTLAVVDEACFALGNQYYDPATEFYSYVRAIPYICRNAVASMFPGKYGISGYGYADEAWGGGGIGGGREMLEAEAPVKTADNAAADGSASAADAVVREIFKNNPLFETISAQSGGTATFTFTVPDNITSWRLTAVAESETSAEIGGVKLGVATSKTIATLPFFVSAYANGRYIFGDEVTVSARVYGTALEGGASTEYIATLTDADGNIIK